MRRYKSNSYQERMHTAQDRPYMQQQPLLISITQSNTAPLNLPTRELPYREPAASSQALLPSDLTELMPVGQPVLPQATVTATTQPPAKATHRILTLWWM